ncbi:MAG: hypothetical protein K0U24_06575 [Gammaproteobacteria bacterium]|nr:hypothetical protein [Gammaproteobacteria bacterium]
MNIRHLLVGVLATSGLLQSSASALSPNKLDVPSHPDYPIINDLRARL